MALGPCALATAATLLLAGLGAVDAAGAPRHARRGCLRRHAKLVVQNRQAQVYSVRGQASASIAGTITYACLRSDRRRVKVGETYNDNYVTSGAVDTLNLVGHVVGSAQHATDISCKADCPPGYQPTVATVQVIDLRRGTRHQAPVSGRLLTRRVFVVSSGAAAWLQGSAGSAQLKALAAGGTVRLLDQGNIDRSSLKLSGAVLSWSKDGRRSSARLA